MESAASIRIRGPLTPHVNGLCTALESCGYAPLSAKNVAGVMAHLSEWLEDEGIAPSDLVESQIDQYLEYRRGAGYTCWRSRRGLEPILRYLRDAGVVRWPVPPSATPTGVDAIVARYSRYVREERGVGERTATFYEQIARAFVCRSQSPQSFTADDVYAFALEESSRCAVGTANLKLTALRSLLRYLHVQGELSTDLAEAVPSVANWRLSSLPKALAPKDVKRLLRACDRRTHNGRRAFAILVLLVRLGLRASEVAALELDDLDWSAGEIVIHGKGGQHDRLPLPADVGEALASYLRRSRPQVASRALFLRVRAPLVGLSSGGVTAIVRAMSIRAGLPVCAAHQLRHTAATEMLRGGSTLSEIAQVLRHRHLDTTAIYAKVDRRALRTLARPWPGSVS